MAARLNRKHTESTIEKIRASQLLNRLQDHALGLLEMSKSEVTATQWLLERILARAESVREVHHSGSLTLEQLITGQVDESDDVSDGRCQR